jgi:phosphoribosylformimino-5-aminoimidazole carboxamide ribotide isomerase
MIIPAIDIQGGEAVRLYKGDFAQKTVYNRDPAAQARLFEEMGAKYLHVVDLDGAKSGLTVNLETVKRIRDSIKIPMQLGGGIRTAETVSTYLDGIGINRVILGTAAVSNPDFLREMLSRYGSERIVAGVDVRNGEDGRYFASVSGWLTDSTEDYTALIEKLTQAGVKYIVLTDISRDGTLTSPNWELYENVRGINVIVSGGVSCEDDLIKAHGYYGVIVGKAYYEGRVDLPKCLKNE